MCLSCHQGLPDETVLKQLNDAIIRPEFDKWNTTSVSHIILAAIGLNGPEARFSAIKLLGQFILWRKTQPLNYIPDSGFEKMYSVEELESDLKFVKMLVPDYSNKHSMLQKYTEYKQLKKWQNNFLFNTIFNNLQEFVGYLFLFFLSLLLIIRFY